jgi:DHA1 family bicyclomycin/chloramphenicol resistance-like MFS transporter
MKDIFKDKRIMFRETRPLFLVVITLMGSVGLLATDIYLPALPEMATYFNCNQVEIQASFTLFLLGLAICQLVYGSLADRFGRKRVTLLGLTLFMIATLLCASAETLGEFLAFRLLQAMGGGVGSVVNRAIIADRYDKLQAAKVFSTIFPIIGLSAAIGPWIGGYLTYFMGWRSVFYFMAGFGAVVWVLVFFFLKEGRKMV